MRGAGSAPKSNVLSSKAIPVQESRKSKSRKQEKSRDRNRCLQRGGSKRFLFEESERFSQPHTGFSCHKRGTGVPSRHYLMKNMSKRSLFVIAGCLLLVLGWWSFHHRTDTAQSSPSTGGGRRGGAGGPGGPVPVVAGKVEQKDVPIFLDGLGTVQAFNTVTVRPRVDGELTQVLFREGEDGKTGDLLAVVDPW